MRTKFIESTPSLRSRGSLALMLLAGMPAAFAQEQDPSSGTLEEVVVTAQKREENLQSVPVSVQAIGNAKLEQLHIQSFDDYAKYLPSLTFQTTGPGTVDVIMRGVPSNGLLPTVGTYLDEQPVTMALVGMLDVHIYDIARVEALAGPQGTLYGASSEAGTLRIITNKPDPSGFKAGYELQGTVAAHSDAGYLAQGYVNLPLFEKAAVRLVGWDEHDGGYIDNIPATVTFPTSGICLANTSPAPAGCSSTPAQARHRFNPVDTRGARAALKLDLDDNWTITPVLMTQTQKTEGAFGYDPKLGDLAVQRFYPDSSHESWTDAALTIQGKLGNLDVVYAGAFLKRDTSGGGDYTEYAIAYDSLVSSSIVNNAGQLINPVQQVTTADYVKSQSHELRVSSPQSWPLRFVAGLFLERQQDLHLENFRIDGLASSLSVPGYPDTWFLVRTNEVHRDSAEFTEISYDLTSQLTATGGIRFFHAQTTAGGFFGQQPQVAECVAPGLPGTPCTNLDSEVSESGHTPKLSLAYRFDSARMVYATWARGFRPGGTNNILGVAPYKADYLTSYEVGWKTSWLGNRLRFNGAIYQEDWNNFQFTFKGQNGIIIRANAGQARIRGIESDLGWAPDERWLFSGGFSLMDPKTTANYCGTLDANGNPITDCAVPLAPTGSQLPGTSKFKGNLVARYSMHFGDFDADLQGAYVYQSSAWPDLQTENRAILGKQSAWGALDMSAGLQWNSYSLELFANNVTDKRGQITRYPECAATMCGPIATYVVTIPTRTIGLKFTQRF